MKRFYQVVRVVEDRARRDEQKRDQPFAVVVVDGEGVPREERYAPPKAGEFLLAEARAQAKECLKSKRDTEEMAGSARSRCQAVILKTHRGEVYGAVAVAGRGSRNVALARFGRDFFFGRKPRPFLPEDPHDKA